MSSLSWDKQCCSPNLRPAQPPGAHLKSFLGPGRAPKGHAVVGADVGPVSAQGRPVLHVAISSTLHNPGRTDRSYSPAHR